MCASLSLAGFAALKVAKGTETATRRAFQTDKPISKRNLKATCLFDRNQKMNATRGDFDAITQAPAGKAVTMLGNSLSFYIDWGEVMADESFGIAYESVWTDSGEVYLKNPVSTLDEWNTYIKGIVTENGDIRFDFPQPLYRLTVEEETIDLYADVLEIGEVADPDDPDDVFETYVPSEETRSITFVKDEIGDYVMDGDYLLGVTSNGMWQGYGEAYLTLHPFESIPVTVPEGVKFDWSYVMADEYTGWDHTVKRLIGIGEADGVTYIKGLAESMPDAVFTGVFDKDANTLTIPSDQFLGQYYNHYIFLMTGTGYTYYDDWFECDMFTIETSANPMVLNYDPATNVFTPVLEEGKDFAFLIFNFGNTEEYPCEYYAVDRIYSQGEISEHTPLTPAILGIEDIWSEDWDYTYLFEYTLFSTNAEDQLLPTENLYYNIFVNGQLYTFKGDEYPNLLDAGIKEMTDIPYSFNNDDDFITFGNYHNIALKGDGIKSIGVRAVYKDGDLREETAIVTIDENGEITGNVDIHESLATVSTEVFDITGCRISDGDSKGIRIRRLVLANGKVKVEKIIK